MSKHSSSESNCTICTIAAAALVGGLAGALVGLMIAPKSGKELRQDICGKASDTMNYVGGTAVHRTENLRQQSADLLLKGKRLAGDLQIFIQESLKLKKNSAANDAENDASFAETPQTDSNPGSVNYSQD